MIDTAKIIDLALSKGFKEVEIDIEKTKNVGINVFNSQVETANSSENIILNICGIYRKRAIYSKVENLSLNSIEATLDSMLEAAKIINTDEESSLFKGGRKYKTIPAEVCDLADVTLDKKMALLFEVEKELLANKKVHKVTNVGYAESHSQQAKINSKGLDLMSNVDFGYIYATALFKDGESFISALEIKAARKFSEFNSKKIVKAIIENGVRQLNGVIPETKGYQVVFSPETFSTVLSAFESNFTALAAYRNLSLLKDKVNTKIAADCVNVLDDPFNKKSFFKNSFDSDGVPTKKRYIIKNGVFLGFINSLKSAKLLKEKPTGNADGFNNMVLEKTNESLKTVLSNNEGGIYITSLMGVHAGVQTTSGDFSIQAKGFLIQNGKLTTSLKQFVVSGNFYEVLKNIKAVGNDFTFGIGSIGAGSVACGILSIAGK